MNDDKFGEGLITGVIATVVLYFAVKAIIFAFTQHVQNRLTIEYVTDEPYAHGVATNLVNSITNEFKNVDCSVKARTYRIELSNPL